MIATGALDRPATKSRLFDVEFTLRRTSVQELELHASHEKRKIRDRCCWTYGEDFMKHIGESTKKLHETCACSHREKLL